jgi:hypothetical protein
MTMIPPVTVPGSSSDLALVPSGLSRLRYFFGQLLTQRDLQDEQRYHLQLRRLLQRESFGTGTVAGLKVEPTGGAAYREITIKAGLAMDPDGRELLLASDACVTVAPVAETPGDAGLTASTPPTKEDLATAFQAYWDDIAFSPQDVFDLWTALTDAGMSEVATDMPGAREGVGVGSLPLTFKLLNQLTKPMDFALPVDQLLWEYLFDRLVGRTYVGLRYGERGAEPAPAVLESTCCGTATCFPSRTEETVAIVAQPSPMAALTDPYAAARDALEECFLEEESEGVEPPTPPVQHGCESCLTDHVLASWRGVPPLDALCGAPTYPVVPLACVYWSRLSRADLTTHDAIPERILSIDNHSHRPLAPGAPVVRGLLEAITLCMSPALQTPVYRAELLNDGIYSYETFGSDDTMVVATVRSEILMKVAGSGLDEDDTWKMTVHQADGTVVDYSSDSPPAFSFTVALREEPSRFIDVTIGKVGLVTGIYELTLNPPAATYRFVSNSTEVAYAPVTIRFYYQAAIS